MALIVEIHVPAINTGSSPGTTWPRSSVTVTEDYPYHWIGEIEAYLAERADDVGFELYDDGEEVGDHYLFFLTRASETTLLAVAAEVAALPGVPRGAFAIVTDDESDEPGVGRRVPLA
jgi:hypothetical protein